MNTKRLFPQVSYRGQMLVAAVVWCIGAFFVGRFGVLFIGRVGWPWWVVVIGLVLGVAKARWMMRPVARRNAARAREHGRDWLLNMYAPRSWVIVAAMITAGVLLRHLGPLENTVYLHFMGALYVTVAVGLALSSLVYWRAFFTDDDSDRTGRTW
ncbi:MAG: hypothetical protein LBS17_03185 [Actinomycetes bacterium]|jgi:cyanate permease|nr:hypothetical protein [Actinomycetes bacterium]